MTSAAPWPNPLIPGFNPDPSIVLVDGVYFLVTSSFEYLPGLPVYRSTDLRQWAHIGNVITRPEQADLENVPTPGGVWAPTIRYRNGVFYLIVTIMLGGRGCVVYTAADPAGPWSTGLSIPAVHGIDPDLAWDEDGTTYVTYAFLDQGIFQVRVDLQTGQALEEPRLLTRGSGLYAPEGPHLYRRGDDWYLMVAEGGTDRGHAVSIARGSSPAGPFAWHTGNPILSARSTDSPVQNLGHADLVDGPGGSTVMVMLGVRPIGLAKAFPLGRETFITTVDWVNGWPQPQMVQLAPRGVNGEQAFTFSSPDDLTDLGWIAVRAVPSDVGSLAACPGRLTINGDGQNLDTPRPRFIGRRQQHLTAVFSTRIDVSAGVGGLAARLDEDHFLAIEASNAEAGSTITARIHLAGFEHVLHAELPAGDVELRMEMKPPARGFTAGAVGGDRIQLVAASGDQEITLAELDGRYWSYETAKSFTGRVVGLYAVQGMVTFADFTYRGSNQETV